jgi:hypothetical protein
MQTGVNPPMIDAGISVLSEVARLESALNIWKQWADWNLYIISFTLFIVYNKL